MRSLDVLRRPRTTQLGHHDRIGLGPQAQIDVLSSLIAVTVILIADGPAMLIARWVMPR
jgi:hypothetical protein